MSKVVFLLFFAYYSPIDDQIHMPTNVLPIYSSTDECGMAGLRKSSELINQGIKIKYMHFVCVEIPDDTTTK